MVFQVIIGDVYIENLTKVQQSLKYCPRVEFYSEEQILETGDRPTTIYFEDFSIILHGGRVCQVFWDISHCYHHQQHQNPSNSKKRGLPRGI